MDSYNLGYVAQSFLFESSPFREKSTVPEFERQVVDGVGSDNYMRIQRDRSDRKPFGKYGSEPIATTSTLTTPCSSNGFSPLFQKSVYFETSLHRDENSPCTNLLEQTKDHYLFGLILQVLFVATVIAYAKVY